MTVLNKSMKYSLKQLSSGYELGCSVAVEHEGKEVINLYGGHTNESKR